MKPAANAPSVEAEEAYPSDLYVVMLQSLADLLRDGNRWLAHDPRCDFYNTRPAEAGDERPDCSCGLDAYKRRVRETA